MASKGFVGKGLCLVESGTNAYWRGSAAIWPLINASVDQGLIAPDATVQVFGELVPCQGGNWTYGYNAPVIRVFDVRVNGVSVPVDSPLVTFWANGWVPVLIRGPFRPQEVRKYREGLEQVSGKQQRIPGRVPCFAYVDRAPRTGHGSP